MIAVAFLVALLALAVTAAATGGQGIPVAEIVALIGVFLLFFGAGVYIAAVLGLLALLVGLTFSDRPFWNFAGQVLWGPSSNFVLVAVPLFMRVEPMTTSGPTSGQIATSTRPGSTGSASNCARGLHVTRSVVAPRSLASRSAPVTYGVRLLAATPQRTSRFESSISRTASTPFAS